MKDINAFIKTLGDPPIEFLRDAMAYFNSRVEIRNQGKTIEQLLREYVELRKAD